MTNPTIKRAVRYLQRQDAQDAISMFILLGYCSYKEIVGESKIDMKLLKNIYDELNAQEERNFENKAPSRGRSSPRRSRSDAMVHFPFADHEGAVQDLFDETNSSSRFYRMGSPARKKLIEKAFDEMCISRSKMRVVDIPEALKLLGLKISRELESAICRRGLVKDVENCSIPIEATVDLHQWHRIVRRCMRSPGAVDIPGVEFKREVPINKAHLIDSDSVSSDGTKPDESENSYDVPTVVPDNYSEILYHSDSKKPSSRKVRDTTSRIADQVRRDRNHWNRIREHRDRAAMAALAKRRLDALTGGSLFRSRTASTGDVQSAVSPATDRIVRTRERGRDLRESMSSHSPGHSRSDKAHRLGRWGDLSTGTAALEIADSFLHGPVGKELASMQFSKYNFESQENEDQEGSEVVAERMDKTAAALLADRSRDSRRIEVNSYIESMSLASAAAVGKPSSSKNTAVISTQQRQEVLSMPLESTAKTMREREDEQAQLRDARALYSQGWRNSRGGWVADFGPAHTHALDLEPKVGFSATDLQDRKSIARSSPMDSMLDWDEVEDALMKGDSRGVVVDGLETGSDFRDPYGSNDDIRTAFESADVLMATQGHARASGSVDMRVRVFELPTTADALWDLPAEDDSSGSGLSFAVIAASDSQRNDTGPIEDSIDRLNDGDN